MKNSYEVLGIPENASESEIKKAYFKLVRKYSPESDPVMFREIREAYEILKAEDGKESVTFPVLEDKLAAAMYQSAAAALKAKDYAKAADICQEALCHFKEAMCFCYVLAGAQIKMGNTGKAVKNFEALVKAYPDHKILQKELAYAYYDRGFTKKSCAAFHKAYEMGCRDAEFVLTYSKNCFDNGESKISRDVLLELVQHDGKQSKDDMMSYLEAFAGLYGTDLTCEESYFDRITQLYFAFLQKWKIYLNGEAELICATLAAAAMGRNTAQRRLLEDVIAFLQKNFYAEDQEMLTMLLEMMEDSALDEDERLGEVVKMGAEAWDARMEDPYVIKFAQLDIKLCMIEEWPEIDAEFKILESDYPKYFEKIADFVKKLRGGKDLKEFKERMQKDYDRMNKNFCDSGYYYERFPEARKGTKQTIWENEEGTPYVRAGQKVGRNDPCPCGSGKKYKNCCGKN